jgi:ferredoxin
VETLGVPLSELEVSDFQLPGKLARAVGVSPISAVEALVRPVIRSAFSPHPRPTKARCTKCGACEQACPTKAIQMDGRVAVVDDKLCIRCYCCHEVCPNAAIDLKFSGMGRVAHQLGLV